MSKTLTVTKTNKTNNTMSEENKDNGLDAILQNKFVQELLKFVSDIRSALGDEKGELENHEVVERARNSYNK